MRSSQQPTQPPAGKFIITPDNLYSTIRTLTYYAPLKYPLSHDTIRVYFLPDLPGAGLGDQGMSHQADSQPASQPAPLTGRKAELCMTAGHD